MTITPRKRRKHPMYYGGVIPSSATINESSILDGSILARLADAETITGLWTFDNDPSAPFAVTAGSAVVTNLDADLLDGQHGSFYQDASNLNAGTLADARVAQTNVTQHEAALTILESQITDGSVLARLASNETVSGDWEHTGHLAVTGGSSTVPTLGHTNQTTGISFASAQINFVRSGAAQAQFDNNGFTLSVDVRADDGTAAAPGLGFKNVTGGGGMWYSSAGAFIGISYEGTNYVRINSGGVDVRNSAVFKVANNQVVGARITGWATATGTATRSTYATFAGQTISSPPTQGEVQNIDDHVVILSERLKALIDDLHASAGHGLIGT